MKRWVSLVLSALLLFSLAACGTGGENDPQQTGPDGSPGISQEPSADGSTAETQETDDGQETLKQEEAEGSHILIAYFTWADISPLTFQDIIFIIFILLTGPSSLLRNRSATPVWA